MSRNALFKYEELRKGDSLSSNNGKWSANFQHDGNFVIYISGQPQWSSDTWGLDVFRLCMNPDCNLVMYDKHDAAKWNTNTSQPGSSTGFCCLRLTDDGKLELYREAELLWSSTDSKGVKC